jgi:hypothetical protein
MHKIRVVHGVEKTKEHRVRRLSDSRTTRTTSSHPDLEQNMGFSNPEVTHNNHAVPNMLLECMREKDTTRTQPRVSTSF